MATEVAAAERTADAFMGTVFDDLVGTVSIAMASIGDRLGLFTDLAERGPSTSEELAGQSGIAERYAREWLSAMACAGYLDYDPLTSRFALPAEHAAVLAEEDGPHFMGGLFHMTPHMFGIFPHLIEAFRTGGGVPQSAYDPQIWAGMERETAPVYEHLLLETWLPGVPDVVRKLEQGALVADVGCGSGRALIKLALAFPNSRFVGYDNFEPQVTRATDNAAAAGLSDRVRFEVRDAANGLPEQYDVVSTFDVVHDAVDPVGLVRSIRQALKPDGIYLIQEFAAGDTLEENIGPLGTFLYSASVMYCMTTSLAHGGAGLGTAGLPESRVRDLAMEAGFGSVRRVPIEDMFHNLYELRP